MLCKKLLVIHHDGEANQKKQARSAPDVRCCFFFNKPKKRIVQKNLGGVCFVTAQWAVGAHSTCVCNVIHIYIINHSEE